MMMMMATRGMVSLKRLNEVLETEPTLVYKKENTQQQISFYQRNEHKKNSTGEQTPEHDRMIS